MELKHFDSAVLFTQYHLNALQNEQDFIKHLQSIMENMPLTHIYLETHRTGIFVPEEKLAACKKAAQNLELKVSGAITLTSGSIDGSLFDTFCYSKPETQEIIKNISRFTAKLFDDFIFDDFFFTHCKCPDCIEAKGSLSWEAFRLKTMAYVADELVIKPAKAVKPQVKIILKYPNWYEHYQGCGYNLHLASHFDGVYTGTETRDPVHTQQNLPRYQSFFTMCYIDAVSKGHNLGGWFDSLDCSYHLNSILEQAYLTLFAKAKEVHFYHAWELVGEDAICAPLLSFAYKRMDQLMPALGKPIGVLTYKPMHSNGEDFLHNYLGMLGIPFEPVCTFPEEKAVLFLNASAAADNELITKLKTQLQNGGTVWLTAELARRLKTKGLDDLIDVRFNTSTLKATQFAFNWADCAYSDYAQSSTAISFNGLDFTTNDAANMIAAQAESMSVPVLLSSTYAKGSLFILNIPETPSMLYQLPAAVLDVLRMHLMADLPITVKGKDSFSLFPYDNDTFILHSFSSHLNTYTLTVQKPSVVLENLETHEIFSGQPGNQTMVFEITLKAGCFKAFKIIEVPISEVCPS